MPPKPQLNLWARFKSRTKKMAVIGLIGATVGAIVANFAGRALPQFKATYAELSAAKRAGYVEAKTSGLPSRNLWQKINPKGRAARAAQLKEIEAQADKHMRSISTKASLTKQAASQTARFAGPDLSRAGMGRAGTGAKWGGAAGLALGTGLPWLVAKKAFFRRRGRGKRGQ